MKCCSQWIPSHAFHHCFIAIDVGGECSEHKYALLKLFPLKPVPPCVELNVRVPHLRIYCQFVVTTTHQLHTLHHPIPPSSYPNTGGSSYPELITKFPHHHFQQLASELVLKLFYSVCALCDRKLQNRIRMGGGYIFPSVPARCSKHGPSSSGVQGPWELEPAVVQWI